VHAFLKLSAQLQRCKKYETLKHFSPETVDPEALGEVAVASFDCERATSLLDVTSSVALPPSS
jgi:hypothetical protein